MGKRQSLYLSEIHVYGGKAARGASSYIALRFQTEKLVLTDGKEEPSNGETLQDVTLTINACP